MCSSDGGDGKTYKHVDCSNDSGIWVQYDGDGSDVCVCRNGVYENGGVYEPTLK
jgi:hypothetical protein